MWNNNLVLFPEGVAYVAVGEFFFLRCDGVDSVLAAISLEKFKEWVECEVIEVERAVASGVVSCDLVA